MNSRLNEDFWAGYQGLTARQKSSVKAAYERFAADPAHPSLRFGKLAGHTDLWYVRVGRSIRIVGHREGDTIVWLWIGPHSAFDRRFGG